MTARRVIFVDPELWTNKENTMTNYCEQPNAADARRASAITIWHRQQNPTGVIEIVRETCETGRSTELLLAILGIHRNALIELRSDTGLSFMAKYVQQLAAGAELADAERAGDIRRSAELLDAHGRDDIPALNKAMQDAIAANRPTQLVTGLLDLYEVLLPELTSECGINWLHACISTFANEEAQGQR